MISFNFYYFFMLFLGFEEYFWLYLQVLNGTEIMNTTQYIQENSIATGTFVIKALEILP